MDKEDPGLQVLESLWPELDPKSVSSDKLTRPRSPGLVRSHPRFSADLVVMADRVEVSCGRGDARALRPHKTLGEGGRGAATPPLPSLLRPLNTASSKEINSCNADKCCASGNAAPDGKERKEGIFFPPEHRHFSIGRGGKMTNKDGH